MSNFPMIVIDLGNALVKYITAASESSFTHALASISQSQYMKGLTGAAGNQTRFNFIKIGAKYFAVGESAEALRVERRQGRSKYAVDYYLPFLLSIIAREYASIIDTDKYPADYAGYIPLADSFSVIASHAPLDGAYSPFLIKSLKNFWEFEAGGQKFSVNIGNVETYDEPVGGYFNAALIYDRTKKSEALSTPLEGYSVGVIDIGGGTISMTKMSPDGSVLRADNGTMGINNTLDLLEQELITAYPKVFGQVRSIPNATRRAALKAGRFIGSGGAVDLDIRRQIEKASIYILNELATMWLTVLNDGIDLDIVILTGGGCGCFQKQVEESIRHGDVRLSEKSEEIQFSNVRGAAKLKKMMGAI